MLCNTCMQPTGDDFQICKKCDREFTTNKYSKRRHFGKACKRETLASQGYRCKCLVRGLDYGCGQKFTPRNQVQYHHKDGESRNNDCTNCAAMHTGCHDMLEREKRKEKRRDDYDDVHNDGGFDDDPMGFRDAGKSMSKMWGS